MTKDGRVAARRRPAVTVVQADPAAADRRRHGVSAKPTLAGLGVDLATLDWQRSGTEAGGFEVAFLTAGPGAELAPDAAAEPRGTVDWVLLRVAGDPDGRVLVYDRTEWLCFVDGAGGGEFDLGSALTRAAVPAG